MTLRLKRAFRRSVSHSTESALRGAPRRVVTVPRMCPCLSASFTFSTDNWQPVILGFRAPARGGREAGAVSLLAPPSLSVGRDTDRWRTDRPCVLVIQRRCTSAPRRAATRYATAAAASQIITLRLVLPSSVRPSPCASEPATEEWNGRSQKVQCTISWWASVTTPFTSGKSRSKSQRFTELGYK